MSKQIDIVRINRFQLFGKAVDPKLMIKMISKIALSIIL